jgi:hypothetical protein
MLGQMILPRDDVGPGHVRVGHARTGNVTQRKVTQRYKRRDPAAYPTAHYRAREVAQKIVIAPSSEPLVHAGD